VLSARFCYDCGTLRTQMGNSAQQKSGGVL
jgi:hypothetical protein